MPKSKQNKQQKRGSNNTVNNSAGNKKLINTLAVAVALFAFLIYANTLRHQYALDDYSFIIENLQTQKGFKAIPDIFKSSYREGYLFKDNSLYRPLSKAMFAAEWDLSANNPFLNHFVNVLFYALSAFLLFKVLLLYLKDNLVIALGATLLFIAHPLHTEVVANIKSRDEIMGFFFFLIAALYSHRFVSDGKIKSLVIVSVAFLFSLFSKESAVTFLAVIPVMFYFFTDANKEKYMRVMFALIISTIVFFVCRYSVVGSSTSDSATITENVLVSAPDYFTRLVSAIAFLGFYLKLFIWPVTLASDHSYAETVLVSASNWKFIASFLILAGASAYAFLNFKKKDVISFSIIFFVITISIVSNIVTLIGTAFAERLVYAPILAFSIIMAVLLAKMLKVNTDTKLSSLSSLLKPNSTYFGLILILLVLYSYKTVSRNRDWYDNLTLYKADVKNAPESVRVHYYLGNHMSQDDFLKKLKTDKERQNAVDTAIIELNKALQLYPNFSDALSQLGKLAMMRKDYKTAEQYYKKAIANNAVIPVYHSNYGAVLFNIGDLNGALIQFEEAARLNPGFPDAYFNMGSIYGQQGKYDEAIAMFKKAIEYQPKYAAAYQFIGITYQNKGDAALAKQYFDKASLISTEQNGK